MSLILAKILGPYLLALGVGLFLNSERYRRIFQQSLNEPHIVFLASLVTLLIGASTMSLHNVWVWEWPVVITILGWFSLVKGFLGVSFPDFIQKFSSLREAKNVSYKLLGALYIILSGFLIYKGIGD